MPGIPNKITRRQALQALGLTGATLLVSPLWGCSRSLKTLAALEENPDNWLAENSPIDRTVVHTKKFVLTGDEPHQAHSVLWDKQDFLARNGKLPEPAEHVKLAVVGGGMSGLMSAYLLRRFNPVVLEVAPRFGGNSRGETWDGIDYSVGAAYFMEQTPGSPIHKLFTEIGAFDIARDKKMADPVALDGKLYFNFWEAETDPKAKEQFAKVAQYLEGVFNDERRYPEIPALTPEARKIVNDLDGETFGDHLKRVCGGELHPHVSMLTEYYCWSTLGASMQEVSAASGMAAFSAEFGGAHVVPGGNAAIAEKLLEKIATKVPRRNLRAHSLVIDVRVEGKTTRVTWIDRNGNLRALRADAVVMACPKFVVKKILHEIEPARKAAIEAIQYRSYFVANVLLDGEIPDTFYDLYLLDKKPAEKPGHKATDVVLATFAKPRKDRTVLTLYRALPHTASRSRMLASGDYTDFREEFEAQIKREILPLFKKTENDLRGLRVNRWGHPIPVALPGQMREGTPEIVRAPFRDRVFFVEQDNWMAPAIETCAIEALHWAPAVQALLNA